MSIFHDITEGGQTTTHRVRMFKQVFLTNTKAAILIAISLYVYLMAQLPVVYYQAAWYNLEALFCISLNEKISVKQDFWRKVAHQHL